MKWTGGRMSERESKRQREGERERGREVVNHFVK